MRFEDQIRRLDNDQAMRCLKMVLKGLEADPAYRDVATSAEGAQSIVSQTCATLCNEKDALKIRNLPNNDPKIAREILLIMCEDPLFFDRVKGAASDPRPVLLEPVTSAILLTGLVIALSTHIKIAVENRNGVKNWKVQIEKRSTSQKIIQKILSLVS